MGETTASRHVKHAHTRAWPPAGCAYIGYILPSLKGLVSLTTGVGFELATHASSMEKLKLERRTETRDCQLWRGVFKRRSGPTPADCCGSQQSKNYKTCCHTGSCCSHRSRVQTAGPTVCTETASSSYVQQQWHTSRWQQVGLLCR